MSFISCLACLRSARQSSGRKTIIVIKKLERQRAGKAGSDPMQTWCYSNVRKSAIKCKRPGGSGARDSRLTVRCLTVGLARTLAVPDSGMAEGCSTSSTLSANKWERVTSLLTGFHKKRRDFREDTRNPPPSKLLISGFLSL